MFKSVFAVIVIAIATLALAQHSAPAPTQGHLPQPKVSFVTPSIPDSPLVFAKEPTFLYDFTTGKLDPTIWFIADYPSPGSEPKFNNHGMYDASAIDFVKGGLRITVNQKQGPNGIVESTGGAIYTKEQFSYGTYVFVMRQSSTSPTIDGVGHTVTGAVSSGFLYRKNSESEIDLEFTGQDNAIHVTNWKNPTPQLPPPAGCNTTEKAKNQFLGTQVRRYTLVWLPDKVQISIDGVVVVTHKTHVPSAPAAIVLQHRGTNTNTWGGTANIGVPRYFFVQSVTYTPLVTK